MRYFKYFPTIEFDLDGNNQTRDVVDVFRMAKVNDIVENNATNYRWYDIQDGERPDHVSMKLYDTVDYHWTFFLLNNNLKNLYQDWPMSREQVEDVVKENFSGYVLTQTDTDDAGKLSVGELVTGLKSGATANIVEVNTSLGWIKVENLSGQFRDEDIVGSTNGNRVSITGQSMERYAAHHYEKDGEIVPRWTPLASKVTQEEFIFAHNETKRQIRVVRPEHINRLALEFRRAINE